MTELSNQRYADLLAYTQLLGGYEVDDLLAAGFSPKEVSEFENISRMIRNTTPPPVSAPEDQAFEAREPTLRESHAATLAELFGGEDYDRGDLLLARKFTGTADPTATFTDSMGLADLLGIGVVYGTEEGKETMLQGARSRDLGTVALGAGEIALNVAGAIPGAKFVTSAGGKLLDDALDAARRAEADRFFSERQTASKGFSGEGAYYSGGRGFIPTEDELAAMRSNPTPAEQVYLDSLERARQMQANGETPDKILASTGILQQPIAHEFGQPVGTREIYFGGGQNFTPLSGEQALRNMPEDSLDIQYVPQAKLGPNVSGDYNPSTGTIRVSEELDLPESLATVEHEVVHLDHDVGLMGRQSSLPEAGSNPGVERQQLLIKVKSLQDVLKDPSQKDLHDTARALLKDIRQSESAFVNYANNPGEILARAASGEDVGYDLVSPKQRLNPYINTDNKSNITRGLDALLMKLRPDLVDLPLLRSMEPSPVRVPMDIRRGQVNDPDYKFSPRP